MSDTYVTRRKLADGFIWRFLERCGAQTVSFVVQIVLSRILLPSTYGTISLVTVFMNILQVFIDSGMANALIQKKDADDTDFSTLFYFNIAVSGLLYGLMYISAPWLAVFFNRPELTSIFRIMSVVLLFSGVKNVQQAYVSRKLLFRKFFFATLGGTAVSAVVGIWMAYNGFEVWALVFQNLINIAVDTIIMWIIVGWKPKLRFSFSRLKILLSYGWKLLASSLLFTGLRNLTDIIIGKRYTNSDLAFYNRGSKFSSIIVDNVNTSFDSVLFPAMSQEQDDRIRVKEMTRRSIITSTYIMAPMMTGLAVCAVPMIRLCMTEKWLPCVFFLRVFCIINIFQPVNTSNLNAIKAIGEAGIFLRLEFYKFAINLAVLLFTMWFGVKVMALGSLCSSLICQMVNAAPNKRLLKYSYMEQIRDIFPILISAALMGAVVFPISYIEIADGAILFLQILIGVMTYFVLSALIKLEPYIYLRDIIKTHIAQLVNRR